MKKTVTILTLLLLPILLSAQQAELEKVIVGNEGNFQAANATITAYDPQTETATDGVFLSRNGVGLGDIVQSLHHYNDELFIVVNNSQKIVTADPDTYIQTGIFTFPSGSSPREIGFVSSNKAYVTDLNTRSVFIIDPSSRNVEAQTISVGSNPDKILIHDGYAYVANNGFGSDSTIFKIDVTTDLVVDTLVVGRGPGTMQVSEDGILWVICTGYSGDFDENFNIVPGTSVPGGLYGIELTSPDSAPVIAELSSAGSDLALNRDGTILYVNSGGVRTYDIASASFSADTLVPGSFYAMGYDESGDELYLADAGNFQNAGEVIIAGSDGVQRGQFDTGIIPGSFLFMYDEVINSTEQNDPVNGFELKQNYPNPFNPSTNISFRIQQAGPVQLSVYSVTGELIMKVEDGILAAGSHSYQVNMQNMASGIYFYRLVTTAGSQTGKMVLLK